jgi:hypothetical protein
VRGNMTTQWWQAVPYSSRTRARASPPSLAACGSARLPVGSPGQAPITLLTWAGVASCNGGAARTLYVGGVATRFRFWGMCTYAIWGNGQQLLRSNT